MREATAMKKGTDDEELVSEFLEKSTLRGSSVKLSQGTKKSYRYDLLMLSRWLSQAGLSLLDAIEGSGLLDSFLTTMRRQNSWGVARTHRARHSIAAFYRYAVGSELMPSSDRVEFSAKRPKPKALPKMTTEAFETILGCLDANSHSPEGHRCILMLMAIYDLRVSEIASLRLDDFDAAKRTLVIRRKLGNRTLVRTILLNQDHAESLDYYVSHERTRLVAKTPSASLLVSRPGRGYSRQGLWKIVRRISRRVGAGLTPTKLRMNEMPEGVDLNTVVRSIVPAGRPVPVMPSIRLGHEAHPARALRAAVSAWHRTEKRRSLRTHLGMTEREYALLMLDPCLEGVLGSITTAKK